ncbi:Ca2-binding protein [Aureococcus anophagefferens]|nr:Ca2-binding protein [Aureococcus anophagefferens]
MVARWMLVALSCAAPAASDDFRSAPLPVAFDERLDVLLEERGVYGEVHRIETEAAYVYEKLGARYGKRLQLPRSPEALVNAWPALFGEPFEERREHAAVGVDFTTTGGKYLGAHRPLLALMFANDTWGGAFDWLAHGDDDTRFELSRLGAYLGARDAALPLFVGMPGHRHYPCKPAAGPLRAADPFACCVDDSQPCRVDVPPSKPYFSFELNRSDTRTIGPGVGGGPGDGTVVVTPCRRRGKRKPCCPVRQRHDDSPFPYRYHPTRGGTTTTSRAGPTAASATPALGADAFTPGSREHALARWVESEGGFVGDVASETRDGVRGLYATKDVPAGALLLRVPEACCIAADEDPQWGLCCASSRRRASSGR